MLLGEGKESRSTTAAEKKTQQWEIAQKGGKKKASLGSVAHAKSAICGEKEGLVLGENWAPFLFNNSHTKDERGGKKARPVQVNRLMEKLSRKKKKGDTSPMGKKRKNPPVPVWDTRFGKEEAPKLLKNES